MIARISGTLIGTTDRFVLIETHGIAYRVFTTSETLLKHAQSSQLTLWTTHIVREDTEELFGFETQSDQDLFELLLGVSGIGPKSALGVMNIATIGTIARAVNTNDVSYLTKISGIGRKTAEKIILELRDKLPDLYPESSSPSSHDTIDALIALGYSESQARETIRGLDETLDTQTKIREALKLLGKNNSY
jgi:Holliday junction DNA helicase RuvA